MKIRLLALLVFLSSFSFGQTLIYTRTVQGNLFLPPGTPAANSRMRFQLKYCQGQNGRVPVNPGNPPGPSGIIVSSAPFDVTVQSDGSWRTQVYGNDQIVCGTDYTGPSRWLIQAVFNGQANAGIEYQIQSCGSASPCQPFSPDSAPRCSLTVVTDCAMESGANPDQPDTTVTVNAVMAVPNAINFSNILLPPANGSLINFMLNGNQAGAYLPGNGNSATCLSGTGSWVLCGSSGGGGGVTGATAGGGLLLSGSTLGMIRSCTTNQYLSWNGSAWICTTLSGGGGGGSFPTTPQYDLFTSTGSGGAQLSGILGGSGFLKGQVILATGDVTSAAAPFPLAPNASVEYFPNGGSFGGLTVGVTNGLAAYFSHSGKSSAGPGFGNGGLMLGGGNNSGTNYQVYLDCESSPALNCDFKVPITVNGAGVGGGGGGAGFPTIPAPNLYASNGAAAAVDSGVLGQSGFLRASVIEATGASGPSPFTVPNGSVEYFPSGATYGGLNIGATNGVSIAFSHSSKTGQAGNGGVALAGANVSGAANTYQIFLDCEQATGCDFKVPITSNGSPIGGGGGGVTGATLNGGLVLSGSTLGMLTSCTTNQYLSWSGTAWTCTTGGGIGLPTIAVNHIFASTGAGAAQDSNVLAAPNVGGTGLGVIKSGASLVSGLIGGTSPFTGSNGSQEWYGGSGVIAGVTVPYGAVLIMGNSSFTAGGATQNGGVVLGGNSAATTSSKEVYVDCEHTGCDFKAPITVNGAAVGGGSSTPNQAVSFSNATTATLTSTTTSLVWDCYDTSTPANAIYPSNVTVSSAFVVTFNFTVQQTGTCVVNASGGGGGTGGGGSGTVSSGTASHFAWYSAAGTTVSSNANLDDGATTAATITSQETVAAPGITVTGTGGIAMTGAGGTLPVAAAGQGGIGIGPGNVPMFTSNGGVWTPITGTTCSTSQKSETGADASVLSCAIAASAGTYRLHVAISVSAASAATLGWTATWTDSNGNAQTPANLSFLQVGTATPALTFTTSTAGNYYGFIDADVNNAGTPIVIKTTFSGTSVAYKISATIERLI